MIFWIALTALATVGILILAWSNYKLAKEIKESREKHDQEMRSLMKLYVTVFALTSKISSKDQLNDYMFRFWEE